MIGVLASLPIELPIPGLDPDNSAWCIFFLAWFLLSAGAVPPRPAKPHENDGPQLSLAGVSATRLYRRSMRSDQGDLIGFCPETIYRQPLLSRRLFHPAELAGALRQGLVQSEIQPAHPGFRLRARARLRDAL
jgi:hypothetical protein